MKWLDPSQGRFAQALRDADVPVPSEWVDPDGLPSRRRFGVYRNNVVAGLANVLADAFPVVRSLVGSEFFHAMACTYVRHELPRSPLLHEYGDSFADFVAAFEPAATLPYLADVARFERAWLEAYHARDADPVSPTERARVAGTDFQHLRVVLHPTLRVVRCAFPIRSLWEWHRDGHPTSSLLLDAEAQDTLFVRPAANVDIRSLRPGAATFVEGLQAGHSPCIAFDRTVRGEPAFDLPATVTELASFGAFVSVDAA